MLLIRTVGLMQENLRLGEDVRTMKKQMDRERQEFHSEIRRMESVTEELQAQLERTVEEHRATVEDYRQKIDALEKQLKSDKQFIEVRHVSFLTAHQLCSCSLPMSICLSVYLSVKCVNCDKTKASSEKSSFVTVKKLTTSFPMSLR